MEGDQDMAEASISIRLAEGVHVTAERLLLQIMSSVLRGAPPSPTWDVSSLRIDGEPVARKTLVDWLNAAHMMLYKTAFVASADDSSADDSSADDSDDGSDDGSDDATIYPATRLYRLLAFADAVGSPPGLLDACASRLERLRLVTQLGQHGGIAWNFTSATHFFNDAGELMALKAVPMRFRGAASADDIDAMRRQLAAQLEQLLYIGHKLRLGELLAKVDAFICNQSIVKDKALLTQPQLQQVFSARVMAAAESSGISLCACTLGGTRFSFTGSDVVTIKPCNLTNQQKEPIKFNATINKACLCVGSGKTVPVELHLFGGSGAAVQAPCIVINGIEVPIRLVMQLQRKADCALLHGSLVTLVHGGVVGVQRKARLHA